MWTGVVAWVAPVVDWGAAAAAVIVALDGWEVEPGVVDDEVAAAEVGVWIAYP